jgi:XapX domain-containing protein
MTAVAGFTNFDPRGKRMKLLIGLIISFAVGVGCRVFDIPVGSPPVIPGALLVLAMTIGYSSTNTILNRRNRPSTTSHLCGGPSGNTAKSSLVTVGIPSIPPSN